jgi:cell division septum initiation protein DivIVA
MAKANDHVQPPLSSAADDVLDTLTRSEADLQDRLEHLREFVATGMTLIHHRVWLDLDEFEERFDQIIAILPKEVRRARKIVREEQRIIQDAKDEARRILEEARAEGSQLVTDARDEAERLVEASAVRQRAVEQSQATLARAEEQAAEVRQKSYDYSSQVLKNVSESLKRLQGSVEQDRSALENMSPEE